MDGFYSLTPELPKDRDRGLEAAVTVLADFMEQVEYHAAGEYPVKIIFLAGGEVYEILYAEPGKEAILNLLLARPEQEPPVRLVILEDAAQVALLAIPNVRAYWCSGSGSYHALIPAAAEAWGLPVSGCTASEPQRITDALSSGKLVVAIMSAGHFTSSGHFIVLRGVQDEKILVADPASRTRSEQSWDLSIILNEASKAAGSGGPFWIIG